MITNRHKTRVLNELLYSWSGNYQLLQGLNEGPIDIMTNEEHNCIQSISYYGIEIELSMMNRKIELTLNLTNDRPTCL